MQLENLESRRLFSAIPAVAFPAAHWLAAPDAAVSSPLKAAAKAKAPVPPPAEPPSLVGDWDGTITTKVLFFKRKTDLKIRLEDQTDTTIDAEFDIGPNTVSGEFKGKVRPNRTFSYKLKDNKDLITFSGKVNQAGTVAWGKISVRFGLVRISGDYVVDRD